MKVTVATILVLLPLAGCAAPRAVPGKAGLRIEVVAEAKHGAIMSQHRLLVYDTPRPKHDHGAFEKVNYAGLDDIVVWAEPAQKYKAPARSAVAVAVRGKDKPRLYVASVGQELAFANDSSQMMNLYSVSDGNEFNLDGLPRAARRGYTVKSPGYIEVLADGVEEPVAIVYVALTPWVWLTHSHANLRADDLPPGECVVKSWHPRLPGGEARTVLEANHTSSVSVAVGVNNLPKVGRP